MSFYRLRMEKGTERRKMHFPLVICSFNRIFEMKLEDTCTRKNKEKGVFLWLFARLIVSLTAFKILTLEKTQILFGFLLA